MPFILTKINFKSKLIQIGKNLAEYILQSNVFSIDNLVILN